MATRKEKVFLLRSMIHGYESLSFVDMSEFKSCAGEYVRIGVGEIEFALETDDAQVKQAVATLEASKQKVRADCQVKLNQIDEQIQSLLAITHEA